MVVGRRLGSRLAVLLALALAACASVLGIEDRTLDTAATFPVQGYDGCRPLGTCGGCLDVHRAECDIRARCVGAASQGPCGACVCESCLAPLVTCQLDAGCAAIWECLQQTRCALSESAEGSCVRACQSLIETHGGLGGQAFRGAVAIRSCAVTGSCLSCLPESEPPPAGCRPQNGCMDCVDCFQQCLCSGDTFTNCRGECAEDAPPAACSTEDECVGCTSCFDVCACGGGDFASCTAECQVQNPAVCTAGTGCSDCEDCVAQCVCGGGAPTQCESACQPPAAEDVCVESNRGPGGASCDGCQSCLAACTCRNADLDDCLDDCTMRACCEAGSCRSTMSTCACDTPVEDCALEYYGSCATIGGCDGCPCANCHDKLALCKDDKSGCIDIFECMRATGCQGSACADRCAPPNGQVEALEAFAVAEALWACTQGAGCACGGASSGTIPCGTVQCSGYAGSRGTLDPCCPSAEPAGATEPVVSDSNACGLILISQTTRGCLPLDQQNPPQPLLETCPAHNVEGPPYHGAALQGCCHAGSSMCGYWDDITGLGCIDAAFFGVENRGCL